MRRLNSRFNKKRTKKENRINRFSIRDKIYNQLARLKKTQTYKVCKSNEPNEEGNYIVYYESSTNRGYGYGKVFKGSYKECCDMAKSLNEIVKERRNLSE